MNKNYIYLVIMSYGYNEDYFEHILKAFKYEEEAKKYAREVDLNNSTTDIIHKMIWKRINTDFSDEYEKANKAHEFDNPYNSKEPEFVLKLKELEEKENKMLLNIAKKYDNHITMDIIKRQKKIDNNKYMDYHPCEVKKIEYIDSINDKTKLI